MFRRSFVSQATRQSLLAAEAGPGAGTERASATVSESSATAIGGLRAASLPIKYLDVRANEMGERGLTAIAAAVQAGSVLAELHVEHALPRPHTYASVDALAAAAQRCAAFRSIYLGDTLVSASPAAYGGGRGRAGYAGGSARPQPACAGAAIAVSAP